MIVITSGTDTLRSLAAQYTLSPEYGDAIARHNGISDDMIQTPVMVPLEAGLSLEIPDNWLKPPAVYSGPYGYSPVIGGAPFKSTGLLIIMGVIAALMLTRRR